MTTLSDGTTTITLPDSLEWRDELDHNGVTQSTRRTIGGSLIVEESANFFGRKITLAGGENVWVSRQVISELEAYANQPGLKMTLTLADARQFTVMFSRDQSPIQAVPVWRQNTYQPTDKVKRVQLRFITVDGS